MKQIYLDHAAATPLDQGVMAAMQPYFADDFYNPSATYLAAQKVHKDVEAARADVAKTLGVRPREIIFTAGGTEANNLAVQGVMLAFPGKHLVVSAIEHKSVLEPAELFEHTLAPVLADGRVDLSKLEQLIQDDTILVSIMLANNEIGSIQPLAEVAELIVRVRTSRQQAGNDLPLYLHTDACQAANYLSVMPHHLGVDLMTLNGGKIYGPKQSGLLYVRTGVQLQPVIRGGGQEWGMRSGTENVPGIVGFAQALKTAAEQHQTEAKRLQALQKQFITGLAQAVPDTAVNGSVKHRLANNVHVTFAGMDNERLMMELDERGVQCAVGSACTASNDEPSHVLMAIGLGQTEAQASLRFTMGRQTTTDQIDTVLGVLKQLCS